MLRQVDAAYVAIIERATNLVHGGANQRQAELGVRACREIPAGAPPPAMSKELEALRLALPQLARLDRYMQRALSRRARAMRAFVAVSVLPRAIKVEWSRQLQLLVAIPQNEAKELRNFKGYTEKAEKSAGEYWSV
jgi:hypothetical protein